MTAKEAITKECQWCLRTRNIANKCANESCKLSSAHDFKSSVRRIKAHCLTCCPEQSIFGVQDCTGVLDKDQSPHGICYLHKFRLGKNPDRKKRILTSDEKNILKERLTRVPKKGLKSQNDSQPIPQVG